MKNRSTSPVTEMLSGKYKIFLTVGLCIMLGIDIIAVAVFLASGIDTVYFAVPLLMLVVDAAYLLGVVVSNQRFKYARGFFLLYTILNIIIFICGLISVFSSDSAVFGSGIAVVWTSLHVVGILTAVVTYLYAAKLVKKWRPMQLALSIVLPFVVVLGVGLGYIALLFEEGYFGQGNTRALIYKYTSDSECEVTGVVGGKGDFIVVPYEFNGHKVTSVSANVLTSGVKNITLSCDSNAALFTDSNKYPYYNTNIVLKVDKDNVDTIKQKLYGYAVNGVANTFDLGNLVRPIGLEKDEVCITFDYDSEAYSLADGKIMPTWYGKKGDVFDIYNIDLDYVRQSDINNDNSLYSRYNANGYIMSELKHDGTALDAMAIVENYYNVPVRFKKIYKVYAQNGNDTMYDVADHFAYSVVDGHKLDYKLTVADNADGILDCFDRGEAFTRNVYTNKDGILRSITSFSQTLSESEEREITIMPYYTLVQPKITILQNGSTDDTDIIYGDDYTLSADFSHPLYDIEATYEWYNESFRTGTDRTLTKRALSVGTERYTATVIVSAPKITSLSSANATEISIKVVRRPLTVIWTAPASEDSVYDGNGKTVTAQLENTVESDVQSNYIYLSQLQFTQSNAGTYTFTARLSGFNSNNYYIESGETTTYTIYPRPTSVIWNDDTQFTYDGNSHHPTASAMGIGSDGNLALRYSGAQVNANAKTGQTSYTATVEIVNSNYTIDSTSQKSKTFTINPKPIDAVWSDTELTYNGAYQAPTASAMDVGGIEMSLSVSGAQVDANAKSGQGTYTATATATDKNYVVTVNETTEFTIAQFGLNVTWPIISLVYSGGAQKPVAVANDVDKQPIILSVTADGNAIDVGDSYTATAIVPNANYKITENETCTFSITPYGLTITWTNTTLTYNGDSQAPTATAIGVLNSPIQITVSGGQIDVGNSYTATASVSDKNYTIAKGETQLFSITPYGLTVSWTDTTLTYSGDSQVPTASAIGVKGQSVQITVSGGQINVGDNYTATASVSDKNYTIANGTSHTFSITPYGITVTWTNTSLTYNGQVQAPTASATGVKGQSVQIAVSGGQINVGEGYIATASVNDKNYTIVSGRTQVFSISQKTISVTLSDRTIEYGEKLYLIERVEGIEEVDKQTVKVDFYIEYTADGNGNIPSGSYEIKVRLIGDTYGNYTISINKQGTLTVNEPKPEADAEYEQAALSPFKKEEAI